eukprot:654100-Amphidinium_carterae.1
MAAAVVEVVCTAGGMRLCLRLGPKAYIWTCYVFQTTRLHLEMRSEAHLSLGIVRQVVSYRKNHMGAFCCNNHMSCF